MSQLDHTNYDCIVICILTHGSTAGVLWGSDETYKIEDIMNHFAGDQCKTLAGKPKIILIQVNL